MGRSADVPRESGRTDGDDTGCPILHVDMDAFFASVEMRDDPRLRGRPVVVGGGTRGVVAAASYEARRYGVRSAMAMTHALRLCPRAIVVPPNRAAYRAASDSVMAILRDVTPLVQPLSLDEAFLDVSGAVRAFGRPVRIAEQIRHRVSDELSLTCSVGIAPTKFVAKVASARCKPDGLLVVPASEVIAFLHPLPVTVLWGVGARTYEQLARLGIRSVGDVASTPADTLARAVGASMAGHLGALADGVDPRPVRTDEIEKSISADHTVDEDLTEVGDVARELLRLAEEVGRRVRERRFVARTIGLKIRFADFSAVTRVRTLPGHTDSTARIYRTALELYEALGLDRPRIRLVGVKCENLEAVDTVSEQLSFDDLVADERASADTGPARGRIDGVLDAARRRFGPAAVGSATSLPGTDPAAVDHGN